MFKKKNCFSKHNLLKRSMEMSNDVSSLSKVRNDIIKDINYIKDINDIIMIRNSFFWKGW